MKLPVIWIGLLFIPVACICQEEMENEQLWETLVQNDNAETSGDADITESETYIKHSINLNEAEAEDLAALNILSAIQINNFIRYRKLLGDIIHVYELQAIPGWNIVLIKKLLPYILISGTSTKGLHHLFENSEQHFIFRYGKTLEPSKGIRENKYLGSNDRFSARYRYNSKNLFRMGFSADKDAGEPFMMKNQKKGFDFYTAHLLIKKIGIIESLAIGDFTVNIGQGLIQWQSLAFKKSAVVLNIKRQSALIRPYTATGEFNFLRGAGITLKKNHATITLFSSFRKISAHLITDTVSGNTSISSFLTSGYHRTTNEMNYRNNVGQFTSGCVAGYSFSGGQLSVNSIYHRYSLPVLKKREPYNLFSLQGRSFLNTSIDYSFTSKNLHFFGETATDKHLAFATLNGIMISLDKKIDVAFLYRHISRRYQSVMGNAFTENNLPGNEEGLYAAISISPMPSLSIEAFMDIFNFPWIKYQVNAASGGKDFLISIKFKPKKKAEYFIRFKSDHKWMNQSGSGLPIDPLVLQDSKSIRVHTHLNLNKSFSLASRLELNSYKKGGNQKENGALIFLNLSFKPALITWSAHARIQLFNIDSYAARIYAFEAQMPGLFSIPSFYGNGKRYFINVNHKLLATPDSRLKIQCSFSWSQTFYQDKTSLGSGLDEIKGGRRSDINIQLNISR